MSFRSITVAAALAGATTLAAGPAFAGQTFEVLTPSGASSASTLAAHASQNICAVSTDTAIYVTFGSAPTASSTTGNRVPANAVAYFRIKAGDKAAVITA